MGIKVVGTGKYPNPKRAGKKGKKPKRKKHPDKKMSLTPEQATKIHKRDRKGLPKGGLLPAFNKLRAEKKKRTTKKKGAY